MSQHLFSVRQTNGVISGLGTFPSQQLAEEAIYAEAHIKSQETGEDFYDIVDRFVVEPINQDILEAITSNCVSDRD